MSGNPDVLHMKTAWSASARVAKIRECAAEINIPYVPPLLHAIDALLEFEDVAVRNVELGGAFI
jgi:hypothetical protein